MKDDVNMLKFEQLAALLTRQILDGTLKENDPVPSISQLTGQYLLSRVTVERSLRQLKKQGYIYQLPGKGFFVADRKEQKLRVLLVFNKISFYKKAVYYGILDILGDRAKVDLQIHHYDPKCFKEIIEENLGKYAYYVVMPHFFYESVEEEYLSVLQMIPPHQLILLDKDVPQLGEGYAAVFQDFEHDVLELLDSAIDLINKYNRLTLIFPFYSHHPQGIIYGAKEFCRKHKISFRLTDNIKQEKLRKGTVYLAISESDLAELIKNSRSTNLEPGRDIGIIAFNETVLKELLDITVITTDFTEMGRIAGGMMLNREIRKVKNPFRLIRRKFL